MGDRGSDLASSGLDIKHGRSSKLLNQRSHREQGAGVAMQALFSDGENIDCSGYRQCGSDMRNMHSEIFQRYEVCKSVHGGEFCYFEATEHSTSNITVRLNRGNFESELNDMQRSNVH